MAKLGSLKSGNTPAPITVAWSAPRCQAKSKRTGEQCGAPAMRDKRVCYHHGGASTGAKTIEGNGRYLLRQTGKQRRHSSDVAVVFSGLISAAEIDLFDQHRIDARPAHGLFNNQGGQIIWPDLRKRAPDAADGRSYSADNNNFFHIFF